MKLKKMWLFLFIIMVITIIACSEDKTKIKFKIICTGSSTSNSFTGYYIADGGDTISFSANPEYDKELENIDFLEISATKSQPDAAITIKIYRDDTRVKYSNLDANYKSDGTNVQNTLTLDYHVGEENTDTDTTDSGS